MVDRPATPTNSLLGDLSEVQLDLLDAIWVRMYNSGQDGRADAWPNWDEVEYDQFQKHPNDDLGEVFNLLPTIPGPPGHRRHPYGLVWREDLQTTTPRPDERIGLSIAGFHRLALSGRHQDIVPDALVGVISELAKQQMQIQPSPGGPLGTEIRLVPYIHPISIPTSDKRYPIPAGSLCELLQKEYPPLNIYSSGGTWMVNLRGRALRPFRTMTTAADYVQYIADDSRRQNKTLTAQEATMPTPTKIFLVHGHNVETKLKVTDLLTRVSGQRPVILSEQLSAGQTIIEKFEVNVSEVACAVVLLTPDDEGRSKKSDAALQARARQNVVFELGYFAGRLGRNKVIAMYDGTVELPSDYNAVMYIDMTNTDEPWQTQLVRELRGVDGLTIDGNAL